MFDIFDSLTAPRVIVISDSEYKELTDRKRREKVKKLELERDYLLRKLEHLDKKIEELSSDESVD
jgi:hypothetical protein